MLRSNARRALTLLLGVSLPIVGLSSLGVTVAHAAGTPIFTEGFKNNSVPDSHWVIGGGFTPCLTASGNTTVTPIESCASTADGAGTGALRLTDNSTSKSGYVLYNSPLPNTAGLDIVFDSYQYNGTGADGIAFFLTDGQYQLVLPGQSGGYLGYAGGNHGIGTGNGVAHGLFGVGLDAYGNFSNFENSGASGNCPNTHTATFVANAVVLRGPGNADQVNYCYLAGGLAPATLHVDGATDRTNGGANNVARLVHIVVDPSSNVAPKVTVSINGTQVLQAAEPAMSPTVKFGWTASTGGATNIHEIQNLTVSTINALNPSLSVTNTVNSGGTFLSGGGGSGDATYTITNSGGANFETKPFTLTVPVPAGLGVTTGNSPDPNMDCTATTATQLSCTYTPTGYGFAPAQSVAVHLLFSPTAGYSQKDLLLSAAVSSPDGGSPTTNQTLQIDPVVLPNAIITNANVQATLAQSARGTSPFTWTAGAPGNAALISSATVDASGNLTVTPVAGASGTTVVPLSVQDPSGAPSAAANVPVTVRPTVQAVTGTGTGPAPVYANIPAPTGTGPFAYAFVTTPNAGTEGAVQFVAGAPEQIKFTPVQGFSGIVPTFTYRVTDAALVASSPATVDITVTKPGPPTVSPVSGTIDANTTFTQAAPAPSGAAPYGYTITTPPSAGTETISNTGVVNFTPPVNTSGVYNSTYQALDQYGQPSSNGQIQVTVRPVAANFSGSTVGVSTLTMNAPAPAGTGPFTWSATPPQTNGTLSMNIATGQVTFTANPGYTGTFGFPYAVSDGVGTSSTGKTVTITVTAPPAPVALAFSSTQNAESTVSAQLPAPSSGTGPFTYSVVSPPASGGLILQPGGHFTFGPAAGTSGIVTFTYQVTDPYNSISSPVTVTLTFRPVAPDLTSATVGPQPVTIPGGSVDGTGPFTYTLVQPPAGQGSATVNQANGAITFTPTLGFAGVAQFSYSVTGAGPTTSLPAQVFVTVTKPAAPVANDLTGTTVSGAATVVTASTGSGVGPFTYAIAAAPSHGFASLSGGNQLQYTSTSPYSGADTFTYTATDSYGTVSPPATVTITVYPIAASPVLGSATGPNPVVATPGAPTGTGPFTYQLVPGSLPPAGQGTTGENSSSGQITFTPVVGFSGAVSFQYTVTDAYGLTSGPGAVTFTVNKPTGPGVSPAAGTTTVNTAIFITPPGATGAPPLTYQISTPPARGTATISAAGIVDYTPNANVSGNDSLQYTATDPYAQTSAPATVTIVVRPNQVDGSAGPATYPTSLSGNVPAGTGTGPFTYSQVSAPGHGVVAFVSDGSFTYTAAVGFAGTDTFTFVDQDGNGLASNVATESVTVNRPAPPVVADVSVTTVANVSVNADGTAGGAGTGPLTYNIGVPSDTSVATSTMDAFTGQITFTPASNASGFTSATFQSTDAWGQASNVAVASVTVYPTSANGSAGPAVYPGTLSASLPAAAGTGLAYVLNTDVSHGTLSLNASGGFDYVPALGFVGTDTFTWYVVDAGGYSSATYTETITVNAPAPPTETDASGTTDAGTALAVQLPAASGPGGPFTYALTGTCPAFGSVIFDPITGAGTFTPAASMSGTTCFRYTATDSYGQTSSPGSLYVLTVRPVAQSATASDNAPGPVTFTPGAPTGTGPFTWALVTTPAVAEGIASMDSGTGAVTFTPTLGYSGSVSFTYAVTGADSVTSLAATITITVVKPAAPSVVDVTGTMVANTILLLPTPGPTGTGPFTYSVTVATHGAATIATSGAITYTPAHNFGGTESFTYQATDAYGQVSNLGGVTITVTKPAAPTVAGVSATTTVNTAVTLTPAVPTGSGPFAWSIGAAPTTGSVTIDATTGVMVFTPAAGASGTVLYTFVATDQYGTPSAPATATVRVSPAAGPTSKTVPAGSGPVTIKLPTPSGTGPFTCTLVLGSLPPASRGTATVNPATCTMTYTPAARFAGRVDFQYTATDASGLTSTAATVAIDVLAAVTVSSSDPTPDTGAHLWKNALPGGSLLMVGLLLLGAGIRMRRRPRTLG